MNLFLYESISAGGLGPAPPASLGAEGWAMLTAALADFAALARITTLLAPTCSDIPGVRCERTSFQDEPQRFRELIAANDAVLVIAPEFDNILADRSTLVVAHGRQLLGCHPDAVRRTADKLALAAHWRACGISTPPTELATDATPATFPVVCKPRDGAGSQATTYIGDPATWRLHRHANQRAWPGRDFIVQPFISGLACSVAFLVGPKQIVPLAPTEQILSGDGCFAYRGGRLPLAESLARRAGQIALAAVRSVPQLTGYVGVDVVLADHGEDVAIEINPRLTTSYIGLRALCRDNLAAAWLELLHGADDIQLAWRSAPVRFDAEGMLESFVLR